MFMETRLHVLLGRGADCMPSLGSRPTRRRVLGLYYRFYALKDPDCGLVLRRRGFRYYPKTA